MNRMHVTVGADTCDLRGFTNSHIQSAVDRVAFLGGGTVELSAGVFQMADSLHLRTGVTVRGQGAETVLRKNALKTARITAFLGYGHDDLVVDTPEVFCVGDGVRVRDDNAFGFYTTVSTLIGRDGDTWYTSRPHSHDYLGCNHAVVETLFSIVEASDVQNAVLEKVVLDGNKAENPVRLTGCRGGGFFAIRSHRLAVRQVTVRDFNGDGFSFQTCDDMELAGCEAHQCQESGFHPGSGSNRFHIHDCRALFNGGCGLFYCLRVRDSLLENCVFEGNGGHGISIGSRDTGHRNRGLTIRANGGCGVFFRPDGPVDSPHGNSIEDCLLEGNCTRNQAEDAELLLQGQPTGVQIVGNTIRRRDTATGILIRAEMPACVMRDNRIEPAGPLAIRDLRTS